MSTGRWFGRDIAKAIGDAIRDAGKGFAVPVSRTAEEVGVVGGRQFDGEGDRWFPGEPDRGFRIKFAPRSPDPTPTENLFPHWLRRNEREVYKAREFSRQFLEETLPIDIVGPDEENDLSVTFRLPASTYNEAVAQGRVPADLVTRFSESATVDHTSPGATAIDQLLDADAKQVSLESAAMKHSDAIREIDDLHDFQEQLPVNVDETRPDIRTTGLGTVRDVYDFDDGVNSVRFINFSNTPLTDEQLRHTANALRFVSEKSGGKLFERLDTIALIPRDHVILAGGGKSYRASQFGYSIAIGDDLEPRGGVDLERYRLAHEPSEGPGSPRRAATGDDYDAILVHELTHAVLRPGTPGLESLPGPAPSLWGRWNTKEQAAEHTAAEFLGGDPMHEIPAEQHQAMDNVWEQTRGKNPAFGPRFIVARQLDLTKRLPLRFDTSRKLRVNIRYALDLAA